MKYPVAFLCQIMGLNRSGYYKWKARQGKLNRYAYAAGRERLDRPD